MNKQSLIDMLKRILNTENNLEFLEKLTQAELETLIASIRNRIDQR